VLFCVRFAPRGMAGWGTAASVGVRTSPRFDVHVVVAHPGVSSDSIPVTHRPLQYGLRLEIIPVKICQRGSLIFRMEMEPRDLDVVQQVLLHPQASK
jgi:hypothetical protein